MPDYTRVFTDEAAAEVARFLNDPARDRPAAVVTVAAGEQAPYIDADEVARELRGLADVYLIATGLHTWAFSRAMAEGTQVYGGAGRVYPVGQEWVTNLAKSPLRFAWGWSDGPKATERIIGDGLDMAAAAGLLGGTDPVSSQDALRTGVVRRSENERAVVDFGGGGLDMGVVAPQLAEPDLPIERVLREGMIVSGVLDPESRRFDIRESRRSAADALSTYEIGEVVLAEVTLVQAETATARLFPGVAVRLGRDDVSADGLDLRTILTPGEVIAARVLATSPWWLTLLDVEEPPLPAASIFTGGPPWLCPPVDNEPEFDSLGEPDGIMPPPDRHAVPRETSSAPARPAAPNGPMPSARADGALALPTSPAVLGATRGGAVRELSLKVDQVRAENSTLERRIAALQEEVNGLRMEREQLASLKNNTERRAARLESELKKSRSALRKASAQRTPPAAPTFADPERGFRHTVEAAWARRIPLAEQASRDLPGYLVGPFFMESVSKLEGISVGKVADVVMELVTGIAESSTGRGLHPLRQGAGGDDPVQTRASDGAVCWRVALQVNTPSARRLHAWRLDDGRWELSSVRKHDDFSP